MSETKLKEEAFKPLFGDWWEKISPFFHEGKFDPIYEFLKKESLRGKKISPLSNNVYRCFIETPLKDLKLIILGMAPYHTFKNFMPIADGLLMSCNVTNKLQPSLENFYSEIERTLYNGVCLNGEKNPDLTFLAKQGVLMFNASLTTEMNKAGSHLDIWEPFTKYMFEEVFAIERVPVLFLGRDAAKFKKYMPPMSWSFEVSHPASASYKQEEWYCEDVFKKINTVTKDYFDYEIEWMDFGNYSELPF